MSLIARLSAPAAGAAAVNCASCPTSTSLDDALDFAGAVHDTVRANGSERLAAIVLRTIRSTRHSARAWRFDDARPRCELQERVLPERRL